MSNNSSSSSSSSGIGCGGLMAVLLTVAFVVLKLTNVIHWSWIWVLAPTWTYIGLVFLILGVIFGGIALIALIVGVVKGIQKKQAEKRRQELAEARRFEAAQTLGTFDKTGERVKSRQPHQWML